MTENTNDPIEPKKLADEDLSEATGGTVWSWNYHQNRMAQEAHKSAMYWQDATNDYGEWLRQTRGEGIYMAWRAMIFSKDKTSYTGYYDDATGKSWTELNNA